MIQINQKGDKRSMAEDIMNVLNFLTISILFFGIAFTPLKAGAHPLKDIILEFNANTKVLNIKAIHKELVLSSKSLKPDDREHFISYIRVLLNKDLMIEQYFKNQSNVEDQAVFYVLTDANPGDKIIVEAKCSVFGTMTKELLVPGNRSEMMRQAGKDTLSMRAKGGKKY
jgi:hypothetical protein